MPRIITGLQKNKKLLVAKKTTRPLTDRIKTSLFDIISELVPHADILDAFAGSGSFGLEAISRGANHATFIESNASAIDLLHQNIANTHCSNLSTIFRGRVSTFANNTTNLFDIIFLDPPFPYKQKIEDFNKLTQFLKSDGIIIIRIPTTDNIDITEAITNDVKKIYEKTYGKSRVLFFRNIL